MDGYCVNKIARDGGSHEVHNLERCRYLPDPVHRQWLGYFSSCVEAVVAARGVYATVDGCYYCANSCHRG